ncbi:MAG: transcriptional repressor [Candidatus Pacearchaeota archaeon]|jgi:Fur family ferric uptake transcriptional regulator
MKTSRKTRQKELMESLVNQMNVFFSAEDFFKIVQKKDPQMGIATVYRFLNSLKKKNKLHLYTCDRRTLYSREKNSHCHYICEKTGKIIHFDIDSLDFLKKIKDKIPGTITSFQLEIRGTCEKCK